MEIVSKLHKTDEEKPNLGEEVHLVWRHDLSNGCEIRTGYLGADGRFHGIHHETFNFTPSHWFRFSL